MKKFVDIYKKFGIYILLTVVFVVFAVAAPNFLSAKNVINIVRQCSMSVSYTHLTLPTKLEV